MAISHLSRERRAAPSVRARACVCTSVSEWDAMLLGATRRAYLPMEPPAEMLQYSNSPSNTGQSSPTLTEGVAAAVRVNLCSSSSSVTTQAPTTSHGRGLTLCLFAYKVIYVVGRYAIEEFHVLVGVKLRHFTLRRWLGALRCQAWVTRMRPGAPREGGERATHEYFHFAIQAVLHYERVTHAYARWLHGMTGAVVIVSNVAVEEVAYARRTLAAQG